MPPLQRGFIWSPSSNPTFILYPLTSHFTFMYTFIHYSWPVFPNRIREGGKSILSTTISILFKIVPETSRCSVNMYWMNEWNQRYLFNSVLGNPSNHKIFLIQKMWSFYCNFYNHLKKILKTLVYFWRTHKNYRNVTHIVRIKLN